MHLPNSLSEFQVSLDTLDFSGAVNFGPEAQSVLTVVSTPFAYASQSHWNLLFLSLVTILSGCLILIKALSMRTAQHKNRKAIDQVPVAFDEKKVQPTTPAPPPSSSWNWGWKNALPVSIALVAHPARGGIGRGRGITKTKRSTSPTFEEPLPAIFATPVPASMAKMIMSRHTFRRPAPGHRSSAAGPSHLRVPAIDEEQTEQDWSRIPLPPSRSPSPTEESHAAPVRAPLPEMSQQSMV